MPCYKCFAYRISNPYYVTYSDNEHVNYRIIPRANSNLPVGGCTAESHWLCPVSEEHQSPSQNLRGFARIPFVQTLLTQCPFTHRSPDQNVIVNVSIYNGTGIKDTLVISTVWTNFV